MDCIYEPMMPQLIPEQDAVLVTTIPTSGDVNLGEIRLLSLDQSGPAESQSEMLVAGLANRGTTLVTFEL